MRLSFAFIGPAVLMFSSATGSRSMSRTSSTRAFDKTDAEAVGLAGELFQARVISPPRRSVPPGFQRRMPAENSPSSSISTQLGRNLTKPAFAEVGLSVDPAMPFRRETDRRLVRRLMLRYRQPLMLGASARSTVFQCAF